MSRKSVVTTKELAQEVGVRPARLRARVRYHAEELERYMSDRDASLHEFNPRHEQIVRAILKLPPVETRR